MFLGKFDQCFMWYVDICRFRGLLKIQGTLKFKDSVRYHASKIWGHWKYMNE